MGGEKVPCLKEFRKIYETRSCSVSREIGFTQHAADLWLRKSFSFDPTQIKRDVR